eukprot:1042947-Rhodomonas_salina.3
MWYSKCGGCMGKLYVERGKTMIEGMASTAFDASWYHHTARQYWTRRSTTPRDSTTHSVAPYRASIPRASTTHAVAASRASTTRQVSTGHGVGRFGYKRTLMSRTAISTRRAKQQQSSSSTPGRPIAPR